MKYWVVVYGLVGKFPTVNGGEIVKNDLLKILTQTIPKQTFFNYCCCHKNELEHRHIFLHLDWVVVVLYIELYKLIPQMQIHMQIQKNNIIQTQRQTLVIKTNIQMLLIQTLLIRCCYQENELTPRHILLHLNWIVVTYIKFTMT